jgi:hypothetical protein
MEEEKRENSKHEHSPFVLDICPFSIVENIIWREGNEIFKVYADSRAYTH